jgi:hypothetical protein
LFLDQVVGRAWDVAFAALFGRCPTDLAAGIANTPKEARLARVEPT